MERQEDFTVTNPMARGHTDLFRSLNKISIALALVIGALCARPAVGEDASQAPLTIRHQPTETHKLPPAGTLMPVAVQLENSSDVDIKIRLVGSRDGRFMDIAFPMGVLNESDKPTYTIQVPAPVKAMTYQFIIHQKGGDLTLSDKFVTKRNCVQTYKVEVAENLPSAEYRKQMATLVAKARSLERDTQNLETAIKLIDGLRKDIPE